MQREAEGLFLVAQREHAIARARGGAVIQTDHVAVLERVLRKRKEIVWILNEQVATQTRTPVCVSLVCEQHRARREAGEAQ
jgi:hypothetical protein